MTVTDRLFRHPYLYSGSVLAKACTLLGTVVWCGIVLVFPQAMSTNRNYEHMLRVLPSEDAWAIGFLVVALPLTWRLSSCARPRKLGILGYALLALLWTYLWWGTVINGQPWPAAASASTVMMVLSLYAFIANPREECHACKPREDGVCPLTGRRCGQARRFDEQQYQGD